MPQEILKPCPFCGGKASINQIALNKVEIKCTRCFVKRTQRCLRRSVEWLKSEMTKKWNTRPQPTDPFDSEWQAMKSSVGIGVNATTPHACPKCLDTGTYAEPGPGEPLIKCGCLSAKNSENMESKQFDSRVPGPSQLTKPAENVSCGNLTNAGDTAPPAALEEAEYILTQIDPVMYQQIKPKIRRVIELILAALARPEGAIPDLGNRYHIEHDGFTGTVIGAYKRLDGEEGVVMQQDGSKVVHVYRRKWLTPAPQESEG